MSYLVDMHSMPSDLVAKQVRKRRGDLGLNREQLAEKCAQLGAPQLTPAALTNIETGRRTADGKRRREVSVEELLVLGRALLTPPILLVFPLGRGEAIEVIPGKGEAPTWDALKWFTGEAPFPQWEDRDEDGFVVAEVGEPGDLEAWEQGAAPVELYRSLERFVREWQIMRRQAAAARRTAADQEVSEDERTAQLEEATFADRTAKSLETTIWEERRRMRQLGITPPDLPENLSHLDTDQSPMQRAFGAGLIRRGSGRTLPSEDE